VKGKKKGGRKLRRGRKKERRPSAAFLGGEALEVLHFKKKRAVEAYARSETKGKERP